MGLLDSLTPYHPEALLVKPRRLVAERALSLDPQFILDTYLSLTLSPPPFGSPPSLSPAPLLPFHTHPRSLLPILLLEWGQDPVRDSRRREGVSVACIPYKVF